MDEIEDCYTDEDLANTEVIEISSVQLGDYFWTILADPMDTTAFSRGRRIEGVKAVSRGGVVEYQIDCEGRHDIGRENSYVRIQKRGLAWSQIVEAFKSYSLPIPPIPERDRKLFKIQGDLDWSSLPYLELNELWDERELRFSLAFGSSGLELVASDLEDGSAPDFAAIEFNDDENLVLYLAIISKPFAVFLRWRFDGGQEAGIEKPVDLLINDCFSFIQWYLSDAKFLGTKEKVWYVVDFDMPENGASIVELVRHKGEAKIALENRESFSTIHDLKDFWEGVRPTVLTVGRDEDLVL